MPSHEFGSLVTHYIKESHSNIRTVALCSGIREQHLGKVINGTAHMNEDNALNLAQMLGIPEENRPEFVMLATGLSIEEIKGKIGTSYFENMLPIDFN